MNAVILAAGRGSRLEERNQGLPKCLLPFGDSSIVEHQIASLYACGVQKIVVVVGYRAAEIQCRLGPTVTYVENPVYERTNSLYSLWMAGRHLRQGFVLMNGDVLFHPGILQRLLHSSYPDAIAIQCKSQFEDEEMKVQLKGDRIVRIDKGLSGHEAHGESLGVAKFSPTGAAALARAMQSLIIQGRKREWAPRAFDLMAARYPIFALDVGQLPWIEIDFPHDLDRANTLIWPEICTAAPIYAVA